MYKSAFSSHAQSRFASVAVDGVLGPPRLARLTDEGSLMQINDFFTKRKQKKIELVARPGVSVEKG